MGSTQVVVVAEQFVVLQKKNQSIHIRKRYSPRLNVVLILTRVGGLRGGGEEDSDTVLHDRVLFWL